MSIKIDKEQIGKVIVGTGKVLVFGLSCLALIVPHVENSISAVKRMTAKADYGEAIRAIMNSDMLGSHQRDSVEAVQKNRDESYYKAVIEIANSDMLGSHKVETIKKISY